MKEQDYERLLNIKTSGKEKLLNDSFHYNVYEPTSYEALDLLADEYHIRSEDSVIDFGCGKGRLNFYLNYFFGATVTGIEMNKYYFEEAMTNKKNYLQNHKTKEDKLNFLCCLAEEYEIKPYDNKFYFFNPFSLSIFIKILGNIFDSLDRHERPIDLILYYPSEDFIDYLENTTAFNLIKEIKLKELYKTDLNQRFLIYHLNYNNPIH
ncbi:MAG: methyltransferase [Clostridium sp.]